jgi:uncharacterized protein YjiS (DUF1127 family)
MQWPAARWLDECEGVGRILPIIAMWIVRVQQRCCPAALFVRSLQDLGIAGCDDPSEVRAPFWRG